MDKAVQRRNCICLERCFAKRHFARQKAGRHFHLKRTHSHARLKMGPIEASARLHNFFGTCEGELNDSFTRKKAQLSSQDSERKVNLRVEHRSWKTCARFYVKSGSSFTAEDFRHFELGRSKSEFQGREQTGHHLLFEPYLPKKSTKTR